MPRGVYPRKRRGRKGRRFNTATRAERARKRANTLYAREMNTAAQAVLNAAELRLGPIGTHNTFTAARIISAASELLGIKQ